MSKSRFCQFFGRLFKILRKPPFGISPGDPDGIPNAIVISDRIPKHSPCRLGVNHCSPPFRFGCAGLHRLALCSVSSLECVPSH